MQPPLGDDASRRGLLSSLADVAKRLINDHDRARAVGGVSRQGAGTSRRDELVVPVSSFRMVGLEDVQAKLADRWPALAEKVHGVAQSVISRHLVRGDVFDRHGDDGYLVLFATLGAAEAEFKSRIIAREIAERLLGEGEAAGLDIAIRCVPIAAEALASGDLETVVNDALAAAEQLAADDSSEAGAAASLPADAASPESPHRYAPVWDTQKMTLLHFRAHIPRLAAAELETRARELQAFRDDLALVRAVSVDLQGLAAEGRRLPVTVAIDHASLASNSQRADLMQVLARIPPGQRKIVTLEVRAPVGDDFWTYGCKSFVEMSRPLGIGLAALVRLDDPQAIPQPGPLRSVAVDLSGLPRREAASLRLLTAFGGYARAQNVECAAYGLGSRALVLGAMGAGFRYVAGPGVHADVTGLATALRFEPLDLYADVQRAAARS